MKGQAFEVNVPGRNGYSINCYSANGDEYSEEQVVNRLEELGQFDDEKDVNSAIVEEMLEYEVRTKNCGMINLENGDYNKPTTVLKDLEII